MYLRGNQWNFIQASRLLRLLQLQKYEEYLELKNVFGIIFFRCSVKKKKLPEKFRYKFMDAYIHIRVNLNLKPDFFS